MHRLFYTVLREEKGYTYIELTMALSLLIMLFPAVFFLSHTVESEFKKIIGREQLQMEYRGFHAYMVREITQSSSISLNGKTLMLQLPDGEFVQYEHKKRQIVRSVKKPGDAHFVGMTIVLQDVYFAALVPDEKGVYMDVGLQNWYASLDVSTYIGKRVEL